MGRCIKLIEINKYRANAYKICINNINNNINKYVYCKLIFIKKYY